MKELVEQLGVDRAIVSRLHEMRKIQKVRKMGTAQLLNSLKISLPVICLVLNIW